MVHATQIRDRLWIGSHQAYDEILNNNLDNITAILNVAMDYFPKYPMHPGQGARYAHVALGDGIDNPIDQISLAVNTAVYFYARCKERLLIHCISGVSRSPYIATLMLQILEHREYDEIYLEIAKLRPQLQVPSFMDIRAHQVGV